MTYLIKHISLRQGLHPPVPGCGNGPSDCPAAEEAVPDTRWSNEDLPPVPGSDHDSAEDEPVQEPEHPPTPAPRPASALDPVTALRYTAPPEETFEQKRQRLNRQETLSFGPQRQHGHHQAGPYEKPAAPEDLTSYAFNAEDIFYKKTHSFILTGDFNDYWKIKAGCLIQHHVLQRRNRRNLMDYADIPVPVDKLDPHRVTADQDDHGPLTTSRR